jgi:HPt (histidine-containing phosphotransfer) domain-containing protein
MKLNLEPDLPVVDRDELVERMMGSIQMAERMLNKFLDSSRAECDALESTVRMGNKTELASLAHRHKGTARTMAAPRVARLARELERRAHTDPTSELLELVDQLRSTHQEIREVVVDGFPSIELAGETHRDDY